MPGIEFKSVVETAGASLLNVKTHAPGPQGSLPITAEMLLREP